ncbi:aminoimidazole riboside kinase [Erwinia sp. BNK-24-b]|uniref:aminoimidazole riboside kinase n=1 Tax=unclassified Erwinia TaxID=2622719 RepID=UPI0039BF46C1
MKRVWVLGDAVIDLLPESDGLLRQCPGGAPANVAVGVARLGGNSGFIGRVGGDPFGAFLQQQLQEEQVDISFMRQLPAQRTSTVVVGLDRQGERTFTFMVRPSADLFLTEQDLPDFSHGEALHFCSIALSAEPSRSAAFSAVERIHAAGGWVSFDPNLREDFWSDRQEMQRIMDKVLSVADVIKLSLDELQLLTGEQQTDTALAAFSSRFRPALLLITLGREGVIVWHKGKTTHFSASPVEVVDTTGAGDAFVAGLLTGLMREKAPLQPENLTDVIGLAQQCGALAVTAKGAMTALPRVEQLEKC